MKKFAISFYVLFMLMIFVGSVNAQKNDSEDTVYKPSEVDQKAEITKKPQAKTDGKCGTAYGTLGRARIDVVLRKSGEVTDVKLVQNSPCDRFNENALEAAKKIKFKPAMKDGQAVSVTVWVEYSYRIY